MVSKSRRRSGGGGSSRIFPWSPKADAVQWGGGGGIASNFPLMGPFYIYFLSCPPPESATGRDQQLLCLIRKTQRYTVCNVESHVFTPNMPGPRIEPRTTSRQASVNLTLPPPRLTLVGVYHISRHGVVSSHPISVPLPYSPLFRSLWYTCRRPFSHDSYFLRIECLHVGIRCL